MKNQQPVSQDLLLTDEEMYRPENKTTGGFLGLLKVRQVIHLNQETGKKEIYWQPVTIANFNEGKLE